MPECGSRTGREEDRARARASRRPVGRTVAIAAVGVLSVGLCKTLLHPPVPLLLWNDTPSSPIGLYAIGSPKRLRTGGIAIAWPPPEARQLAARRNYLPATVPLVKTVAAMSGAHVCAHGERIIIDGREAAIRKWTDSSGRRLPWWSGCVRLRDGELFLLSPGIVEAFDGRYFGITRSSEIIGSGTLLWPR